MAGWHGASHVVATQVIATATHGKRCESLYRMLSKHGNPSLKSLGKLLSSLGFRLAVEKMSAA